MFGKPLRLALAIALLAIGNACSHGGHDAAPFAGEADAGDKPVPVVDPCETPNKGCACETADEVVDCGQVERRSGDYVSCTIGKRTCDGTTNTWGECIGDRIATLNVPASGPQTQGLGTTKACTDNPCDPYCQRVVDDANGLNLDGGPFINDGGLTMKATIPLAVATTCTGLSITPATQDVTISALNSAYLKAEYFNQTSTSITSIPSSWTVTATRTEANINNNYAGAAPGVAGIGATYFSVRWTGSVIPTTTEAYTFYPSADDGVRLWVNGTLVVDQWKDQGTTEYASPAISLTAGTPALFRMEYYQGGGGSAVYLKWSSPTIAKQIIPATAIGDPTGKRGRLTVTPAIQPYTVSVVPAGCFAGTLTPAWSLDRFDVATVTNGTVNLISAVPGTINVTAYLGQFSATAKLNVKVNATDTTLAPTNAVTNFAKAVSASDPMTILYPYANTVLPLGLIPPVIQWDNGGTAASAVQVGLRYPATGTATFSWNEIIPESSPPSAAIPQAVWKDFENSGKGADVSIRIQRVIGSSPGQAVTRTLHFSSAPVRGLIYYTQYNRSGSTNMMVADPSSTAPAKSAFNTVDGCPVCHSVSANGTYFATSDKSWSATNGGLSKISGGVLNPIADFVSSRDAYTAGSNDWRGFAWAPLTPDGTLALAANNIWGNTNQTLVGINSSRQFTVPNTIQSGGTGTGLLAKYFPNTTFTTASPLWKRIDPIVNFSHGTASPGGLVPTNYSVTRTGLIQAYTSETYTFQIDTTDAVKLIINGTTVIDATSNQTGAGVAPKTFTGTIAMTAGAKVPIQIDQADTANESSIKLSWSSASVPSMVVPEAQLYPNDGIHGLDVNYYANPSFTAPVALNRLEPDIYADWGSGNPATETTLPTDNFSDIWQGQIESPYTGNVVFCIDANDTAKVTVGSTVVLNVNATATDTCSSNVSMTQGVLYNLKVEHVEKLTTALLKLRWKYGGLTERIPTANLYAPASYTPPTNGLTVSYYTDQVFNGNLGQNPTLQNSFTRYDTTLYNNWSTGRTEFSQMTSSDNMSARWTGLLTAPCSGVYEFQTDGLVDDGGRLWIDQIRVANTWTYASFYGSTYLDAGDHDFKFSWYDGGGGAAAALQWKVNCQKGTPFVAIPTSAFKPTGDTNRSGMMRDGGDNGNNTSYSIWQTPQTTGASPVDLSGNFPGVWGLGRTAMMLPSFSPDSTKLVFVDGDSAGGAGWRKGLSLFDFEQTNSLFKRRRSIVNTWPFGDVIKWPTFESDSRSIIYQTTTPTDACCTNTGWTKYGYMGPTNYFEDPGRLWSVDSSAATPTPVALTNLNSGERAVDANKAYQPTVSPKAAGGYRWVVFTSTRPYGNTFNLPAVQQNYSNTSSYTQITNYNQIQSALWIAALDDVPSAGVDRSHPAFLLPNQVYSTTGANYLNERGFWVLDGCKTNGTGSANSCEVDEDCCGGLTSPKTAVCKLDSPVTDPPTRHCAAQSTVGACIADGGVCGTTNDCCLGSVCLNGTCAPPPPLLILGPANYERTYTAVCDPGTKAVWRFFDWQTITPSANSKIEFYAQTSAKGTDFATLPTYPTAVTTSGVVKLGTASGAPNTSWIGSDVGALLLAAGFKSQQYLKVTIRMVPNDALSAAPTLTNWRQNYSCVPAE